MKPTISIIAALSENRVIGNKGQIPWHIKSDLIRFRDKTLGKVVIMGRRAFESTWKYYQKYNKPLPKRIHIVVSRDASLKYDLENVHIVHSIEEAIELARSLCDDEIFIAGGGQIYEQGIKYANKLYLTIVKGNYEGDAFFPDYSDFKKIISLQDHEENGLKFTFLELQRTTLPAGTSFSG